MSREAIQGPVGETSLSFSSFDLVPIESHERRRRRRSLATV
jgi:hypothetical protein